MRWVRWFRTVLRAISALEQNRFRDVHRRVAGVPLALTTIQKRYNTTLTHRPDRFAAQSKSVPFVRRRPASLSIETDKSRFLRRR